MKTYARLQDGRVAEFLSTAADIATLFNHQLSWIDVSADSGVRIGWVQQAGGRLVPPPAELASAAIAVPAIADLHAQLNALQAQLTALGTASNPVTPAAVATAK